MGARVCGLLAVAGLSVTLAEGAVPDDAMLFGDLSALSVMQLGPQTLGIIIQVPVAIGMTPWAIYRQPAYHAGGESGGGCDCGAVSPAAPGSSKS